MKNKNILLLRTLLLSTSQRNIYKHTTDKKKKRRIVGNTIGLTFLYLMLMMYSIFICIGYGVVGLADSIPVMCAIAISSLAFMFTVFKTNGYLFNFKEYDMLMSLPFDSGSVAGCKFLYMYVKSMPWYLSISFAMLLGYLIYAKVGVISVIFWIILSFVLPIIPMLLASFIGFLIARVSTGFRKNNLIQTVLTLIFVIFCFSLRYIIEAIFRNQAVEATLENMAQMTDKAGKIYFPVMWFTDAVSKGSVIGFLLLVAVSVALFVLLFKIVGKSYRNINSALKSHAASKKYKMTGQKKNSVLNAIAYKEFKRFLGSTTYTVNGGMGYVLAVLLGIFTLFFGFDKLIGVFTQNAPFDYSLVYPAIPFIVHFLAGMMATTACSPSLEGKNYWIVQSLPITKKTLYQGKMLFNMYLSVPVMAFTTLCFCISARVPVINTILDLILGLALSAFATTWGCVCGIRHMRLDWENEVEVIKQGAAVAIYMLPNMFVVMGLAALMIFLATVMDHIVLTLLFTAIAFLLAFLSYRRVLRLAR